MCYNLWYNAPTMLLAGPLPTISLVHYTTSCNTQSNAPEDGQNNCPKYVELIGIINKQLLSHLVGCLYYLYHWCTVKQISNPQLLFSGKFIPYFQAPFFLCTIILNSHLHRCLQNGHFLLDLSLKYFLHFLCPSSPSIWSK